jgi:hypothetical protein
MRSSPREFAAERKLGVSRALFRRLSVGPVIPDPGQPPASYRPTNLGAYLDGVNTAPGVEIWPG